MTTDKNIKTSKNVKAIIILSIILLTAFAGCTTKEQTISTPGGDLKVSQGSGSGPAWCKTGTKMTMTGATGQQGSFEIKGIVNYEGREVCMSEYVGDEGSMEQYFSQDSSYMVMVTKDKSGKIINKLDISQPK
ncbi:MAG: hypothetical protein FIB07_10940 [Candidatus Methanoperedens sp.]|nr:hypothetical protein [Candidatus Methanoperedens sp.]